MAPDTPVADVIEAARTLTGKPAKQSDVELIEWLQSQEISTQADLVGLADDTFLDLKKAPGMSLVLFDALSSVRRGRPAEQASSSTSKKRLSVAVSVIEGDDTNEKPTLAIVEMSGAVGTITMNYNQKRNVISHKMCEEIRAGVLGCVKMGAKAIILRATPGVKVWSAGHDVRDFKRIDGSSARDQSSSGFQDPLSREDMFVQLVSELQNLTIPLIGAIEGSVWGAATDICAICDLLVCTPEASFAITPVKIGIPYNASGLAHFVQVLPLHVVKWMFFSGTPLNAEEAHAYGFVNFIVPNEELTAKSNEMATMIASRAPMVVSLLKKQVNTLCTTPSMTPETFEELHLMRKQCWSSRDMEEGVKAFFEKRQPEFKGF